MEEQLKREAEFWENFDLNSLKYGMPYWVDLRNADFLNTPKRYVWCDPKIEELLYGRVKGALFAALPSEKCRVLDVGCGAGWLSLELARMGHEVTAVDIAEKRIDIARETAMRNNCDIDYRVIPLEAICAHEPFDVIVSYGSLHHFPRIGEAVGKINDLLKSGGFFLMVENCGNSLRDIVNWSRKNLLGRDESSRSPYEDVSTKQLVAEVKSAFAIEKEFYDLSFSKVAAELFDFICPDTPSARFYPWLRFSRKLDRLASGLGVPRGEVVFMQAIKQ